MLLKKRYKHITFLRRSFQNSSLDRDMFACTGSMRNISPKCEMYLGKKLRHVRKMLVYSPLYTFLYTLSYIKSSINTLKACYSVAYGYKWGVFIYYWDVGTLALPEHWVIYQVLIKNAWKFLWQQHYFYCVTVCRIMCKRVYFVTSGAHTHIQLILNLWCKSLNSFLHFRMSGAITNKFGGWRYVTCHT